ncbi:MAG TPA: molybdopterin oxidoreductase [Chloroflexi bacterium]|nr:molybdopterin oxidoreductase [Chloroflexota bacterium]
MSKTLHRIAWVIAVAGFAVGLPGLYQRLTLGHQGTNYGSYVPWGLWVAAYIYFIGLSAGAFLLSTLVYVFQVKRLEKIGKLALFTALVTLVAAMFSIWLDLGHPLRAWRLLLRTNFSSVMGWMIWFYSAYFVLLVLELWFALRPDLAAYSDEPGLKGTLCRFLTFGRTDRSEPALQRDRTILRALGTIGVPLAVAFHGGVGALFGVVGARPYWHGGLTPIMFLVGALVSGGALLTFVTAIWGPDRGSDEHRRLVIFLGQIVLGLLAFDLLLEWAEYSIGLYSAAPAEAASLRLVLFGRYWWVFWGIHLGLGALIPLLLLVFQGRIPAAVATASALIAISFLSVRLNIVIPGLAVEELKGLSAAFSGPGLNFTYFPSPMEWLFFIWTVSLAGLLFLIGYSLLPIVRPTEVAS